MFIRILLFSILINFATANEVQLVRDAYFESYKHEANKNYPNAILALSRLHKKYPKGYTLNLRMGYLHYLLKDYSSSLSYYRRASRTSPASNEAKLGLTRVYIKAKNFKKAQELAFAMLKTDYYSFYGNLYAIHALLGQKKYDTALAIINKMLAIFPTNITYLEELAKLYKETNHKHLNNIYETIYILDPNNNLLKNK